MVVPSGSCDDASAKQEAVSQTRLDQGGQKQFASDSSDRSTIISSGGELYHDSRDLIASSAWQAANDLTPKIDYAEQLESSYYNNDVRRLKHMTRANQLDHEKPMKKTKQRPTLEQEGTNKMELTGAKQPKQLTAASNGKKNNRTLIGQTQCWPGKQALILLLFIIGLIVCVSSIVCILLLPSLVSNQIAKKLVLKNNSMLLERWSKPNVPMFFKVYLFNVKNAQELIDKRAIKPEIEEIGPFVFNLKRQKDVVSFAGDNLYYTERRIYHFNRELSCCAINSSVTIPNIPLIAVVDRALGYNLPLVGRFIPRLINRAIQSLREQLFVRRQVREILFDGYDVELLRMVSRIGSLVGLPQQSQKFALLKGRNDTWRPEQDGVWAINTGQRDRKQFGRVSSWNSYKKLPFWSGAQCNVINGSDGTLFPPPIKSTEPLYIFNQELCRTVNLVFDRPSDVRSIQAYRFVLNPLNFAHTVSASSSSSSSATAAATPTTSAIPNIRVPVSGHEQQQHQHQHRHHHQHSTPATKPPGVEQNAQGQTRTTRDLKPGADSDAIKPIANLQENQLNQQTGSINSRPNTQLHSKPGDRTIPRPIQSGQLSEQEKLVRVAQETQLISEKRAQSQMNPQTCFCDRKTTNLNGLNVCEFDGLIDLSKCSKQAQVVFGSMPHFHNSDPRLLNQVSGLEPNASRHTTYLDIEPNTGLVLGGKRRVQLNVLIKHNNEIDGFENIRDMLVPIIWFEESAMIPEESAQKFRSLYVDRVRFINWTLLSLLAASILLLIVDARLLVSTHYWRRFKLITTASTAATSDSPIKDSQLKTVERKDDAEFQKPLSAGNDMIKGDTLAQNSLVGNKSFKSRRQAEFSNAANLPLLKQSSSSISTRSYTTKTTATTSNSALNSSCSSSSSSGESVPSSPELQKWSPAQRDWTRNQQAADRSSLIKPTRVYLNARPEDAKPAEVDGATRQPETTIISVNGRKR